MLQLRNTSPLGTDFYVLPDRDGFDTLFVVVKACFRLWPRLELIEQPVAPFRVDEFWGDSSDSSLKHPSEVHIGKPATDVLVIGRALAPDSRTDAMTVTLLVERTSKSIYVFGDRFWMPTGEPSGPSRFETIPLVFERAYGGTRISSDGTTLSYDANPVGIGFAADREPREMIGQPVPNLERPDRRLTHVSRPVEPAGLAATAPHWAPRRSYAGTYDEEWQRTRAPFLPGDFDPRFLQSALPDQTFDPVLRGGEPISLTGIAPHGQLDFLLPRVDIGVGALTRSERLKLETELETVLIEPDDNLLSLSYRSKHRIVRSPLDIREITVSLHNVFID